MRFAQYVAAQGFEEAYGGREGLSAFAQSIDWAGLERDYGPASDQLFAALLSAAEEGVSGMEYSDEELQMLGAIVRRGEAQQGQPAGLARYMLPQSMQRFGAPTTPAAAAARPMPPPPGGGYVTETRAAEMIKAALSGFAGAGLPDWMRGYVPGGPVSDDGELMSPFGLGSGTLTSAAGVLTLLQSPQRPFEGQRLVVVIFRSAGAALVPVDLSAFKIGENSQLVGSGLLPADQFAPNAFGVRLAMSPCTPGVNVLVEFRSTVPLGESIAVQASIVGRAVWGAKS